MNKKGIASLALLAVLTIAVVGLIRMGMDTPPPNGNDENNENYENYTEFFPYYENFRDRDLFRVGNVIGSSMEPTFGDNDALLYVEIENVYELRVGYILLYRHPTHPNGEYIAHRIRSILYDRDRPRFETKGDNNTQSDAETALSAYLVKEEDMVGLVIGVEHGGADG